MFDFLANKFSGVLTFLRDRGRLSDDVLKKAQKDVRNALLDADVPLDVVGAFLGSIDERVTNGDIANKPGAAQQYIKIVHEELLSFLGGQVERAPSFRIPSIIMTIGLTGSGKTTTLAKLAHHIFDEAKKRGKTRKILCASVDFTRPAAIEQLAILARSVGTEFHYPAAREPRAAAHEVVARFRKGSYDHLLLDTAGRLHVENHMLEEVATIKRDLAIKHVLLVLDAMSGQQSLAVAKAFETHVGFEGAILTKMDSETRAGSAFAFRYVLKKPILFVGSGEKLSDLEPFIPKRMTSRILGMGDVESLLEKVDAQVDVKTQEGLARKMMKGGFTLDDFAQQIALISKMGSLQKMAKYLPGGGKISTHELERGEREMQIFQAILSSMTLKERKNPSILDASRRRRIAAGAGVRVEGVNGMLRRFEESKQYARMVRKSNFRNLFR